MFVFHFVCIFPIAKINNNNNNNNNNNGLKLKIWLLK